MNSLSLLGIVSPPLSNVYNDKFGISFIMLTLTMSTIGELFISLKKHKEKSYILRSNGKIIHLYHIWTLHLAITKVEDFSLL